MAQKKVVKAKKKPEAVQESVAAPEIAVAELVNENPKEPEVKKEEAKPKPKKASKSTIGKPFTLKPRTDQYFYDKLQDLHDEVKKEMVRRQREGERWRALFPVLQRLFIILQGLRIFVTVPK